MYLLSTKLFKEFVMKGDNPDENLLRRLKGKGKGKENGNGNGNGITWGGEFRSGSSSELKWKK